MDKETRAIAEEVAKHVFGRRVSRGIIGRCGRLQTHWSRI